MPDRGFCALWGVFMPFCRLGFGVCLSLLGQSLVTCVQSTLQTSHPVSRSDLYVLKEYVDGGCLLACANALDWSCLLLRALPWVPSCTWIPKLGRRKQHSHTGADSSESWVVSSSSSCSWMWHGLTETPVKWLSQGFMLSWSRGGRWPPLEWGAWVLCGVGNWCCAGAEAFGGWDA